MNKEIFSFDIFDTCLIRACGKPQNVIYLLAREILGADADSVLIREFIRKRSEAEEKLIKDGILYATFDQIYEVFDASFYTDVPNEVIKRKEYELERKILIPVPEMVQKVNECRKKGNVMFISDMYLPSSFLREILESYDIIKPGEHLYVSCEHSATKRSGLLFKKVSEIEGIKFDRHWTHYGDDFINDYSVPRKLGIKAVRFNNVNSEFEDFCESLSPYNADKWVHKVFAGVLRATRISLNVHNDGNFLSDVICGIITPFVASCLNDAKQRGVKRLYFASRDAYIMYLAAKKLLVEDSDIELKYLYLSTRTVVYPTLIKECTEQELRDLLVCLHSFKPLTILNLLGGVGEEDVDLISKHIDLNTDCYYNSQQCDKFISLLTTGDIKQRIADSCQKKNQLLIEYLKQEGFINDTGQKTALVDIGWRCTSQLFLSRLTGNSPMYYYLGVAHDNYRIDQMGSYLPFFLTDYVGGARPEFLENYVCNNPANTVIGYEYDSEGIVHPQFEVGEKPEEERLDFEIRKRAIEISSELFSRMPSLQTNAMNLFETISNRLIIDVLQSPSNDIVKFLSKRLFFEYDNKKQPVIRKSYISRRIIEKILRKIGMNIPVKRYYWPKACMVYTYGNSYFFIKRYISKMIDNDNIRYVISKLKE